MASAIYMEDAPIPELVSALLDLPRTADQTVLLLVAEHTTIDIQALVDALKQHDIRFAGGVFPGVIFGANRYESGLVVDTLPTALAPSIVSGLDSTHFSMNHLPKFAKNNMSTALVLVDGLTKHIALFLDRLFRQYGNKVQYIGGGAGSLSFVQKPCLFDNRGIYQDAAMVLWLQSKTQLGIQHGWQHLRGPYIADKTEGTSIAQLGNFPAFQLYNQIIKERTGMALTKENFFGFAKRYPLGIFHAGMDYIVRDPIAFTDDGALICVGEIPRGAMVYILQGEAKNLIEHAEKATTEAMSNNGMSHHNLIIDCISRVLFLEDNFNLELQAVMNALPVNAPTPYGILSLGEIATYKTGRVEFFNKTFVVGALMDEVVP